MIDALQESDLYLFALNRRFYKELMNKYVVCIKSGKSITLLTLVCVFSL